MKPCNHKKCCQRKCCRPDVTWTCARCGETGHDWCDQAHSVCAAHPMHQGWRATPHNLAFSDGRVSA